MFLWHAATLESCAPGVDPCFDEPLGPVIFIVGIVLALVVVMIVVNRMRRD